MTSAEANFTVRLAPGQDVETIRKAVEQLVTDAAPEGAEVDIRFDRGTPASVVDPKSAAIQLGSKAFEKVFGREPLLCAAAARCRSWRRSRSAGCPSC